MTNLFKSTAILACLAFGLASSIDAEEPQTNASQEKTTHILFIGNSYTFFNSLNDMVQEMLNVSDVPTEAKRNAPGGWRLRQHFNGELPKKPGKDLAPTPEVIKSKQWDYVVLQEQSSGAVDKRDEFLEYGKKLCDLIHENCPTTKVLLYQTWGRCDGMFEGYGDDDARKSKVLAAWEKRYSAPDEATVVALKDGMQGGYAALAKATDSTVVPVGKAFKEVGDKLDLHAPEGDARPHHPNASGTYLGACVFFKTITGKSPVGLYQKLADAGKDFKVTKEDAEYLEQVADKVCD